MIKSVSVKFNREYSKTKTYDYLVPEYLQSKNIKIGDYVIVDSPFSGFELVKVASVHKLVRAASKYIVDVVDTSMYEEQKQKELRKTELKKTLDKMKKELEEVAVWELLASKNPEVAKMLEEYKSL